MTDLEYWKARARLAKSCIDDIDRDIPAGDDADISPQLMNKSPFGKEDKTIKHYTDIELNELWYQSFTIPSNVPMETYDQIRTNAMLRKTIDYLMEMRSLEEKYSIEKCYDLMKSYMESAVDYYKQLAEVKGGL